MKQRLLIVDDEPGIVDMMASYFSSQYEVLTAYCGNEALQKLARQPDLILLDINMPDIDGVTLCQKIRELITCPILFLTARVESADKIIGFQAGADDYIIKPFDLDELGARVAAHLRREQRHRNKATIRFFGELTIDYSARYRCMTCLKLRKKRSRELSLPRTFLTFLLTSGILYIKRRKC